MNKEPLGLYLLRLFFGFGLFLFMLMLYWSSTLIEHDMKSIKEQLETIKKEIVSRPVSYPQKAPQFFVAPRKAVALQANDSPYRNLLEEDPFYNVTLPNMLGDQFKPQGLLRGASTGEPANLHPFSAWGTILQWISMCNVGVANQKFGFYESFSPDMALRMELRDNSKTGIPEYWIFLRQDVFRPMLAKILCPDRVGAISFIVFIVIYDFLSIWKILIDKTSQRSKARCHSFRAVF